MKKRGLPGGTRQAGCSDNTTNAARPQSRQRGCCSRRVAEAGRDLYLSVAKDDLGKRSGALRGGGVAVVQIVLKGSDRPSRFGAIRMYGSHTSGSRFGRGRRYRAGLQQTR
jgi:hypothetical protein